MSLLTDLIAATPQDAEAILSTSGHATVWPTFEAKRMDPIKLASLAFILQGKPLAVEPVSAYARAFENLVTASEDGPWIDLVPADLTEALALLSDDRIDAVARAWAATEEAQADRWQAEELVPTLRELSAFAATALAQNRRLLLWISL